MHSYMPVRGRWQLWEHQARLLALTLPYRPCPSRHGLPSALLHSLMESHCLRTPASQKASNLSMSLATVSLGGHGRSALHACKYHCSHLSVCSCTLSVQSLQAQEEANQLGGQLIALEFPPGLSKKTLYPTASLCTGTSKCTHPPV